MRIAKNSSPRIEIKNFLKPIISEARQRDISPVSFFELRPKNVPRPPGLYLDDTLENINYTDYYSFVFPIQQSD